MSRIVYLVNKFYTLYLSIVYKSLDFKDNVIVDFRCEIEKKSNINIEKRSVLYKNITIYKAKESKLSIGKDSHIAPYGYFLMDKNSIYIGDNVAMAKNCSLFCVSNMIPKERSLLFKDSYLKGDIIIGNNVFIGTNVVILPNTIIEDNVVVGANSTIKGKLESGYIYGGNPAKQIRRVFNV